MYTLTRYSPLAALALIGAAAPALSQDIVVNPPSTQALASQLSATLDNQLKRTLRTDRGGVTEGYAVIRFTRGADGRPEDVTLRQQSGDRDVARLAHRAVSRMPSVPAGMPADQQFQANIVIADSEMGLDRQSRKLARFEESRIAASSSERTVLAFNGATSFGR